MLDNLSSISGIPIKKRDDSKLLPLKFLTKNHLIYCENFEETLSKYISSKHIYLAFDNKKNIESPVVFDLDIIEKDWFELFFMCKPYLETDYCGLNFEFAEYSNYSKKLLLKEIIPQENISEGYKKSLFTIN